MKKLLTLVGIANLSGGFGTALVGCTVNPETIVDDDTGSFKDIEILDKISKQAIDAFLEFSQNSSTLDTNDHSDVDFDKLYALVTKELSTAILNKNNPDVTPVLNILDSKFNIAFNNINNVITNEYSNYYVDSKPLKLLNSSRYTLHYIDLVTLGKINGEKDLSNLKAGRIDFKFRFQVKFKKYVMTSVYVIQYTISNDTAKIKKLQSGIVSKLSKVVVRFFNEKGKIILDKTPGFRTLYDNFYINYSKRHIDLDNIIQQQLTTLINSDPELAEIKEYVTWNADQELLLLQMGALNDVTSGVAVPSRPENTAYVWAGEGPFDSSKVTADTFYQFLMKLLNVFNISGNDLQLASFTVNLSKLTVAGLTLNGVIENNTGNALAVIIAISKEGLKTKLMDYSQIVVKFFETYCVESYLRYQQLVVPSNVFDQMKAARNYMDSLKPLVQDFINRPEISTLPGINLFNIDDAVGRLKQKYPTWRVKDDDTLQINARGKGYSFSFMLGDKSFYGSIAYSPWSAVYFGNFYLKKG
ncbi:hypothetical protein D6D54_06815 [Spiroplasma poulsonii]|uniref:Lipoprotein n=1 Tax=Spiroplasma poulsonii TaxID=2138 RepID=A0A433EP30_9MOLU|nr:hypothetical protein [Spiroplasma poulsonii]MBW3058680.1 hypothetical protein [Spiroplasma poulsonii]RUP76124.1 hypothetical protein D6D54_06815 [Spiroplasma poulsonii]